MTVANGQIADEDTFNNAFISQTTIDQPNGTPSLDASTLLKDSQIPLKYMEYLGDWNASTNSPTLANTDTDQNGSVYRVSTAGSVDFGAGSISFDEGDWVYNDGSVWRNKTQGSGGGGGGAETITSVSTSTSLTINDGVVLADSTSGDITLTLPTAVGNEGLSLKIIYVGTANRVTIDGNGSETVGDAVDYTLYKPNASVEVISDNSNFQILSKNNERPIITIESGASAHTNGVGATTSYKTRSLTSLAGDTTFISLSSNQFTLDAGTYFISFGVGGYQNNTRIEAAIYNVTGAAIYEEFLNIDLDVSSTANQMSLSSINAIIDITSQTTFEIRTRSDNAAGTEYLGRVVIERTN